MLICGCSCFWRDLWRLFSGAKWDFPCKSLVNYLEDYGRGVLGSVQIYASHDRETFKSVSQGQGDVVYIFWQGSGQLMIKLEKWLFTNESISNQLPCQVEACYFQILEAWTSLIHNLFPPQPIYQYIFYITKNYIKNETLIDFFLSSFSFFCRVVVYTKTHIAQNEHQNMICKRINIPYNRNQINTHKYTKLLNKL